MTERKKKRGERNREVGGGGYKENNTEGQRVRGQKRESARQRARERQRKRRNAIE